MTILRAASQSLLEGVENADPASLLVNSIIDSVNV